MAESREICIPCIVCGGSIRVEINLKSNGNQSVRRICMGCGRPLKITRIESEDEEIVSYIIEVIRE